MAKKTDSRSQTELKSNKQPAPQATGKKQRSGGVNINYLTKMGLKNLFSNRSMTLSSVSVLTACLLLIGVSLMILFNIQSMVKQVESQNVVIAFVEKGLDEAATVQVGEDLKKVANVSSVEFVSKEDAFIDQLESYGVEAKSFTDLLENPLPDCYHVTVSNLDNFEITLANIKSVKNISSIRESQELVGQITALQKSVSAICAVIVILLFVVSVFIITNTIKITMVYRKTDIQVMKSVGATNTFVRWPFIVEGVVIGVVSALIALGLTYAVERLEGDAFSSFITLFGGGAVSIFDHWPILVVCYIGGGLMIGIFGSIVTMAKYLRKEGSEASEI
ncbi:MAG: cell division protein FtsX [Acutalibacteraceae bacterium]|nr:permease-like cell division protein FtsX [Oscillospiraceae bacterium]